MADQADPPKQRPPEMRTWTAEQLRAFLDSVRDDSLYAAWLLEATTGMRRGELVGLRWSDIDFDTAPVSIRRSLISIGYKVEFSEPKTARGRRSLALDGATLATLREHRRQQLEIRLAVGPAYQDQDLVFAEVDGSPIHPERLADRFERLAKEAGLPRIRFHDLRHTFATMALQAGIHPKVVSERLGHATVSLTLDVYSHAVPALQEEAAERVASLVLG